MEIMDSSYKIIKFSEDSRPDRLSEIKYIFYISSSVKEFKDEQHKEEFFNKWCGDYLRLYPEQFYLMIDSENNLLGYLSGMNNSLLALNSMRVPGFKIYSDLFESFPAHLHINFHPSTRGKGYGSILVGHYLEELKSAGVKGIHLVTSPDAKNVSFYTRLGFDQIYIRENNGYPTQFMGKKL